VESANVSLGLCVNRSTVCQSTAGAIALLLGDG
jgi:hypothetical protein